MSTIYRVLSALLAAAVAVQFLLAGAGAFGATSFHAHRQLGTALVAVGALALLAAILSRREARLAAAIEGMLVLQFVLGRLGEHHPWIGALHGLAAIAVAGLVGLSARRLLASRHA